LTAIRSARSDACPPGSGSAFQINLRGGTSQKEIALTYDCGDSGAVRHQPYLTCCGDRLVSASIFLGREWNGTEQFPDLSKRIANVGQNSNHTKATRHTKLSTNKFVRIFSSEDSNRRVKLLWIPVHFFASLTILQTIGTWAVGQAGFSYSFQ
jgi:hypothetical protein